MTLLTPATTRTSVLSAGFAGTPARTRAWDPTPPAATRHRRQRGHQLIGAPIAVDLSMTVRYVIGSLLVVIGLVSLLLGGFRWTQQKTVVDIGPIEAKTEEHKTLPIPPVVGALALIGGIVVLVVPTRRRV